MTRVSRSISVQVRPAAWGSSRGRRHMRRQHRAIGWECQVTVHEHHIATDTWCVVTIYHNRSNFHYSCSVTICSAVQRDRDGVKQQSHPMNITTLTHGSGSEQEQVVPLWRHIVVVSSPPSSKRRKIARSPDVGSARSARWRIGTKAVDKELVDVRV